MLIVRKYIDFISSFQFMNTDGKLQYQSLQACWKQTNNHANGAFLLPSSKLISRQRKKFYSVHMLINVLIKYNH